MFFNKHWQRLYKFLAWMIWQYTVHNIYISDHPDLDQPILYLQNAFTGKFALCISPALKSGTYECQETWFLAAYQYPWTTESLVRCKEHYIESNNL